MSDSKTDDKEWPTHHENKMSEHFSKLYDIFAASRAQVRAGQSEEDVTRRAESLEDTKEAPEDNMTIEITHKKLEDTTS